MILMNQKVRASKAQVFNQTIETYFATTRSPEVKSLIAEIRSTDDADKRRQLKSQLPFRCPHYFSFKDGRRAQANIIPEEFTFQTCVDIDDMSQVEQALSRAYLINTNEGEWQGMLLHAERSASGKLHLDIRLPIGMTIEEAQRAYTKALGVDFDRDCCSPERMIYISDDESQLYTADGWYARLSDEEVAARRKAYTDRGLSIDGRCKVSVSSPELGEARKGLNTSLTTVSNLSSTRALRDVTEKYGGQYTAAAVGEVNVTTKMKEVGAIIGGEGNGGVIYPESHYGRDALVGIALFLSSLAQKGCTVSELRRTFPDYQIAKNRIDLTPGTDVDAILAKVKQMFANDNSATVNDIDGVKIDFPDRWVHLRKSNTEPIIRVYSEAQTMAMADELGKKLMQVVYDMQ